MVAKVTRERILAAALDMFSQNGYPGASSSRPGFIGGLVSMTMRILSAILLAMCLLLTGCGGKSTFEGSRTSSETEFRMEYIVLDKEESAELELSEGDQIQVRISHTAGNVDVTVGQNGEEPIYRGSGQENADFILTISKTGSYQISVTGRRAKGEVSFTRIATKEE